MNKWNEWVSGYPLHLDMAILSHYYYGILTQLRTQHIRLNECYHMLNHRVYYSTISLLSLPINLITCIVAGCCDRCSSGLCNVCFLNESVYHFIFECHRYDMQRMTFLRTIMDILLNKYDYNINLKNVLFPPNNVKIQHRKAIFNALIHYVVSTKRLVEDY